MSGIDYGMGQTNIDHETGIRYGVIHQHHVLQAWCDESEADYGEPHCPKCGNEASVGVSHTETNDDGSVTCWTEHPDECEDYEVSGCGDYRCDDCRIMFDSDEAYGDEPIGHYLRDDDEYVAQRYGDDGDILVLRSPYYTLCSFCSPCAPGAGYLTTPGSVKAYCFGPDWFDNEPCPYKVYRVDNDELVYDPEESDHEDA